MSSILVRIPAWERHYRNGVWRFEFVAGAVIEWYAYQTGRVSVRGKENDPVFPALQGLQEKILKDTAPPGTQSEALTEFEGMLALLVPSRQVQVPVVPGVGWQCSEEPGKSEARYAFTDGAVIRYYSSTKTVQLQGTPSLATGQALESLPKRYLGGSTELTAILQSIFPDWRLGQDVMTPIQNQQPRQQTAIQPSPDPIPSAQDSQGIVPWRRLWPRGKPFRRAYPETRPCQQQMIEDWAAVLRHEEGFTTLLAHAPTGLGKTVAALVPALAWVAQQPQIRRVYYLVNRETQHDNPIRELRDWLAAEFHTMCGQPLHVVDIVGRKRMCLDPNTDELTERCKASVTGGDPRLLQDTRGWREIKAALTPQWCPYHTMQGLMPKAHIIVCDYWWLFSRTAQEKKLTSLAGFSSANSLVIVDEGHNLPPRVRSEFDVELTQIEAEALLNRTTPEARNCLLPVLSRLQQEPLNEAIMQSELVSVAHGSAAVQEALATLANQRSSEDQDGNPVSNMLNLLLRPEQEVVIYRSSNLAGMETILFRQIDPTPIMRSGFEQVHAALVMSGTLAGPADSLEELEYQLPLFGLSMVGSRPAKARRYASPFPLRHQQWILCDDTYGTYDNRTVNIPQYVRHIANIGSSVEGVTAVFFSSYALLNQVQEALISAYPDVAALVVSENQEEMSGDDVSLLDTYRQELEKRLASDGHAYLFAVYQGKIAEGANFTNNLLRCIVCVSVPVEFPGLFHQRLEASYEQLFTPVVQKQGDDLRRKAHEYAHDRVSLSLVLQACGRGIRSESDRCVFVLLDKRYGPSKHGTTGYGWARFLAPNPFNLSKPALSVRSFLSPPPPEPAGEWDSILVDACQKEKLHGN